MSLPNFIDKAALSASQILQGFDFAAFEERLLAQRIAIEFGEKAAQSPEGQTALELAANLLARLFPRLSIVTYGDTGAAEAHRLQSIIRDINPTIDIQPSRDEATVSLIVGELQSELPIPCVCIGSDGWIARVATKPCAIGSSRNPFGASAAACIGVANIFRHVFSDQLAHAPFDEALSLSLFDFSLNASAGSNPLLEPIALGEVVLVGLGAIGNAAVWSLARIHALIGTLDLVDHEFVDIGNLQRYLLTSQSTIGRSKVELAAEYLSSRALTARCHGVRWDEYMASRSDWNLPCVAVAVDSAKDRCAVQAALPRLILNAWTQPGDLGVSRHTFVEEGACLTCLYLPDGKQKNEDQLVSEAVGLPNLVVEIRKLLHTGLPVGEDFVRQVATAQQLPVERLLEFKNVSIRTFYSQVVCGGMLLRLGGHGTSAQTEVPMAFQSALAGVLLAREIVAAALKNPAMHQPEITRLNLLRPIGSHLSFPAKKHMSGRCICHDDDYIAAYRAKYAEPLGATCAASITVSRHEPSD